MHMKTTKPVRKPYRCPNVRVYGDIRELTLLVTKFAVNADNKLGKNTKTV